MLNPGKSRCPVSDRLTESYNTQSGDLVFNLNLSISTRQHTFLSSHPRSNCEREYTEKTRLPRQSRFSLPIPFRLVFSILVRLCDLLLSASRIPSSTSSVPPTPITFHHHSRLQNKECHNGRVLRGYRIFTYELVRRQAGFPFSIHSVRSSSSGLIARQASRNGRV